MQKRKNIIKIAIDSPAAAGAGTQAKLISKHYNLLCLLYTSPSPRDLSTSRMPSSA